MKKSAYLALAVLLAWPFASSLQADYARADLVKIPVDRLVKNLETLVNAKPKDVRLRFNLARVHAMAFASKTRETRVQKDHFNSTIKAERGAWFGYEPRHIPFQLIQTKDAAKLKAAKAHLQLALRRYQEVLELDPKHLSANLGYGWCLQQAGKKKEAIAQYRKTIEVGWEDEKPLPRDENDLDEPPIARTLPFRGPGWYSVVAETSGYLTPLLDPEKDREELATLKERVAMSRIDRAITPIALPLSDGLEVADLTDLKARVPFDADGSGEKGNWSWITRDAAWLVYDQKGDGQVASALQLFGSVTFWLFWNNGYEALATLDDNADGRLSGEELQHLALWRDANGKGVRDNGEII